MVIRRGLGAGERFGEIAGDLEDTQGGFLRFLELLLHGVFLGLEREDGGVAFRQGIEVSLGLFGCKGREFGCHQVADRADVLLVFDPRKDALEELRNMAAGVRRIQRCIESFVRALAMVRMDNIW